MVYALPTGAVLLTSCAKGRNIVPIEMDAQVLFGGNVEKFDDELKALDPKSYVYACTSRSAMGSLKDCTF